MAVITLPGIPPGPADLRRTVGIEDAALTRCGNGWRLAPVAGRETTVSGQALRGSGC
jgi:hypothetical protein